MLNDIRSGILTFIAGAAAGAVVALLLAPKAGKEIRHDIKEFAGDTREKVSATVEKGKELYEQGKSAVTGAIEAGRNAYLQEKSRHAA
jgi:gas vesicle protein